MRLPSWLFGNDVLALARKANLKLHTVDAAAHRWDIETIEGLEDRKPGLFELIPIAGGERRPDWDALTNLPGRSPAIDPALLAAERERLLGGPGATSFTALATWLKLITSTAPNSELAAVVQGAFESLRDVGDGGGRASFPDVSVDFVRVSEALANRAALARVLMRVEEEPELLDKKPTSVGGKTVFSSGWHLQSDLVYTRDAYLGPLLLCLSPWVWALSGARTSGGVIYNLGTTLIGRPGEVSDLLQLFLPPGTPTSPPRPGIDSSDTSEAIAWWVEQLDQIFGVVTDPARYTDADGDFRSRRQFQVLLSVEQLGRCLSR